MQYRKADARMPTASTSPDIHSSEPLAGVQASAAGLLGTAAVVLRADGRPRWPLTAVGEGYRALAAYPAGMQWLLDAAAAPARTAVEGGRAATARHRGMGMAAFPVPGSPPCALVVFTTIVPDAALVAAELGIPAPPLPRRLSGPAAAKVTATLRFIEQALALAGGSDAPRSADPETRRYRILYAASQTLARATDEDEVLRAAAESLTGILHMDHAVPFRYRAGEWRPGEGVSYWGEPLADAGPLLLDGFQESALLEGRIVADGGSTSRRLLVPVIFQGALEAVIAVECAHSPRAPLSAEEDFALLVARQAALALRAARDAALQNTLARTLQETLQSHFDRTELPRTDVQEFYRPAAQDARVGGDFYDVFTLPGGRVAVLVGDVAGKGLESAIHTTLARYTLRSYALLSPDPAEVIRLSNEALARFREFKDFLTLAMVVLDPEAGRLSFASAGHCPVFLYRRRADAIGTLESTGTLLGMMPGISWDSESHKWEPGDAILLYTDGISEAHPPGSFDLFETTRIRDLFAARRHAPPQDILHTIFDAAHTYSDGVMHDDCAMLLVTHREA